MKSIFAIVLGFSLVACGPYKASKNASPLQETEKIVLLNTVLRNLNVVKHGAQALPDGRMQVTAEFENEKNKDIWADIQVIFRDAAGQELERSSWTPVQFHRRTVTPFTKASLKTGVSDYRLIVRNVK